MPEPFYVKDCTLSALATGIKAQSLTEFRDRLAIIPGNSIYHHFWGGRLGTSFEHREYHNDFSNWAHRSLHDDILGERLELLNPRAYGDMDRLRGDLLEIIEDRLDEIEYIPWAKRDQQFHFIESIIVVFSTRYEIEKPSDLVRVFPLLTRSSIFYHFIDCGRRVPGQIDDVSAWLQSFGDKYQGLISKLCLIDSYLISLTDLQQKIGSIINEYFLMEKHE